MIQLKVSYMAAILLGTTVIFSTFGMERKTRHKHTSKRITFKKIAEEPKKDLKKNNSKEKPYSIKTTPANNNLINLIQEADKLSLTTETVNNKNIYNSDYENDEFIKDLDSIEINCSATIPVYFLTPIKRTDKAMNVPSKLAIKLTNGTRAGDLEAITELLQENRRELLKHPLGSIYCNLVYGKNLPQCFSSETAWNIWEVPNGAVVAGKLLTKEEILEMAIKLSPVNKSQKLLQLK